MTAENTPSSGRAVKAALRAGTRGPGFGRTSVEAFLRDRAKPQALAYVATPSAERIASQSSASAAPPPGAAPLAPDASARAPPPPGRRRRARRPRAPPGPAPAARAGGAARPPRPARADGGARAGALALLAGYDAAVEPDDAQRSPT